MDSERGVTRANDVSSLARPARPEWTVTRRARQAARAAATPKDRAAMERLRQNDGIGSPAPLQGLAAGPLVR